MTFAATGEKGEKKKLINGTEISKDAEPDNPAPTKEKGDSLKLMNSEFSTQPTYPDYSNYKDDHIQADSLDESGSVLSFNFIQYIIQRFKFSEEIY